MYIHILTQIFTFSPFFPSSTSSSQDFEKEQQAAARMTHKRKRRVGLWRQGEGDDSQVEREMTKEKPSARRRGNKFGETRNRRPIPAPQTQDEKKIEKCDLCELFDGRQQVATLVTQRNEHSSASRNRLNLTFHLRLESLDFFWVDFDLE